jgi:hypothetical protein
MRAALISSGALEFGPGTFVNAWHSDQQFKAAAKMLLLMDAELDPDMKRFMAAAMQAYARVRTP